MNELKDLEDFLIAARKIGEKLHVEKNLLAKENAKLREENQRILAERNNLLVEMNNLLVENERLRKINATFGENLAQLPRQFQFIMQNEFQKFLTMSSSTSDENFDEENNLIVPTETEILDVEENLPANLQDNQPKKKMVYAEFYAEEAGFKEI